MAHQSRSGSTAGRVQSMAIAARLSARSTSGVAPHLFIGCRSLQSFAARQTSIGARLAFACRRHSSYSSCGVPTCPRPPAGTGPLLIRWCPGRCRPGDAARPRGRSLHAARCQHHQQSVDSALCPVRVHQSHQCLATQDRGDSTRAPARPLVSRSGGYGSGLLMLCPPGLCLLYTSFRRLSACRQALTAFFFSFPRPLAHLASVLR